MILRTLGRPVPSLASPSAVSRGARALRATLAACCLLGCGGPSAGPDAQAGHQAVRPTSCCSHRDLDTAADRAVSADPAVARVAIEALRAAGPEGLEALLARHAKELPAPSDPRPTDGTAAARLRAAIDGVARQRDAHASRLYWYTDLEAAKARARSTGKPILSLRLLGDLGDDLSCANSRFFRTALYPDAAVSRRLRERFVLHWSSERPAPRITIEFGDGRRLERTITGNSVHYVLDEEGRPIDALPGLYGPAAFLRGVDAALAVHTQGLPLDVEGRRELRRAFHAGRREVLAKQWQDDVAASGGLAAPLPMARKGGAKPSAALAAPIAASKMMVEAPMVRAIQADVVPLPTPANAPAWARLLQRHAPDARLDASSRGLVRAKMGEADDAAFGRKLASFEQVMAEDTVRNEYTLHLVVHEWLAMSPAPEDLESLNGRVYASLFLTPRSDPWLGLLSEDAYSGIEAEGITR